MDLMEILKEIRSIKKLKSILLTKEQRILYEEVIDIESGSNMKEEKN